MKSNIVLLNLLSLLTVSSDTLALLCGTACNLHTLQFNDEFDGVSVDETTWNYRVDSGQSGIVSQQLPENVAVGGGIMSITLQDQSANEYNYTGGGLISKRAFQYGYYETNISFNDGQGWRGSFSLNAGNGTLLIAPKDLVLRTEVDVLMVDSAQPNGAHHQVIETRGIETIATLGIGYNSSQDFRQWHVLGLLWSEDAVNVYVNNSLVWVQPYTPQTWRHNYLNIWFSGVAVGDGSGGTNPPGSIRVDYIRFYQRDYYITAGPLCDLFSQIFPCPSVVSYVEAGVWHDFVQDGYTKGLVSRVACGTSSGSAMWSKVIPVTGTYQVFVHILSFPDSDQNVAYDVFRNGVLIQSRSFINQTGVDRWENILQVQNGVNINAGERYMVTATSSQGATECTRADAIKFVRVA